MRKAIQHTLKGDKMKSLLKTISVAILCANYSALAQSNPCKIDPERCSTETAICGTIWTAPTEEVKCSVVNKIRVSCLLSKFSHITASFNSIPSKETLAITFSKLCFDIPECKKIFQCKTELCNLQAYPSLEYFEKCIPCGGSTKCDGIPDNRFPPVYLND